MAIITVSRGTYVGGTALAERLAERLGYQCLSREAVLAAAATSYGVPSAKLTAAMDKPPSFWERLIGDRTHYINLVKAALFENMQPDRAVNHGHIGHLLMEGVSHVIRVRAISGMETRIKTAMQRHSLSRDMAIAHIKQGDGDRQRWNRFLYGVDWEDPLLYDVVLNLGRLGVEGACDVVVRMTELEVFQPTDRSMKVMGDLALGSKVWAVLATDPTTAGADLKVTANSGIVDIEGVAGSWEVADSIPVAALRVPGVRDVRSKVGVAPPVYDVSI